MTYKYCPECGRQGTVQAEDRTKSHCSNCGADFWNNPSATVCGLFLKDGKALFAKRAIEPDKGKYDFPGGFLEYNEDIYEGLAREIYEEMAVKVKPADLQLVTGYAREYVPGTSVIDFLMVVKRWQGEFKPQDDVAALEWKPLSFINDKRFAPREYVDLIKRLAELA